MDTETTLQSATLSGLAEHGWVLIEEALPEPLNRALREDCLREYESDQFEIAGISKNHVVRSDIRRDLIRWWAPKEEEKPRSDFQTFTEALRVDLNRLFFLGLHEIEIHYAVYEKGAFYKRHLDQFQDHQNRRISMVYYLNPEWTEAAGGCLRIHHADGNVTDIPPKAGNLLLFRSDLIDHEVLPTQEQRLAVTGWFRNRSWPLH